MRSHMRTLCKSICHYALHRSRQSISPIYKKQFTNIQFTCTSIQFSLTKPLNFKQVVREFSIDAFDHIKEIDEINVKFAEAREEIEMALESKETVYFNEEAECAREAVKTVLDMFDNLSSRLTESERTALHRLMGLKMEQLKAELEQLND